MVRAAEAQESPQGVLRPRGSYELDSCFSSRPSRVARIANCDSSPGWGSEGKHMVRGTRSITAGSDRLSPPAAANLEG